ncbi:hypothetical protein HY409_03815 [Candidatus Gottesmanbacteria bacterium]|nr:hypothetical protein [Candidatus Gottesmanbacteria bacterium]
MDDFLEEAPEWFLNLLSRALADGDDDASESLLGIGGLLARGDESEAVRLAKQLNKRLVVHHAVGVCGESGSTQLEQMLESSLYPFDLRNRIRRSVEGE